MVHMAGISRTLPIIAPYLEAHQPGMHLIRGREWCVRSTWIAAFETASKRQEREKSQIMSCNIDLMVRWTMVAKGMESRPKPTAADMTKYLTVV